MSVAEQERGQRQVSRVLEDTDGSLDNRYEGPLEPSVAGDRMKTLSHTNFSRIRTEWGPEERIAMDEIRARARMAIRDAFKDAFDLMEHIFEMAREPLFSEANGEVLTTIDGRIRWKENAYGNPVEDWSRLSDKDRDDVLFSITMHLFEWEQRAADIWGDSMYAKGIWEEAFAAAFIAPKGSLTVDHKTQLGHNASMEQRYFAIFQAVLSKQAEAVIRSMTRIHAVLERTARRM